MNKIVSSVEDSHASRSEPSVFKDKALHHESVCLEEVVDRQRAQRQHELVGFIRILDFPDFIVKTFVCGKGVLQKSVSNPILDIPNFGTLILVHLGTFRHLTCPEGLKMHRFSLVPQHI